MAQLALNGRPNSAIGGMSLLFLRHGYEIDQIMESTANNDEKPRHPGKLCAEKLLKRLKDAQDFAQAAMASA